jgi:Fe-S-cluster-containing dehydrogenase component/DMSO reductase anchor subunit
MTQVKGFIFNYNKCVGCHACMVACYAENSTQPPISWRQVNHFNKEKLPLLGFVHLSIACNHCKEAPCKLACPSGAYSIDKETLAVIHSHEKCIGCKYCTWACPFDAPKYNPQSRVVEKCNFCNQRLKVGQIPSCALNCPTGALSYGDIEESAHPHSFGLSLKKIYPRLKVIGSDVKYSIPLMDSAASGVEFSDVKKYFNKKELPLINIAEEWPLAAFTFLGSLLVGWIFANSLSNSIGISIWTFCFLALVGILLSVFHLGKPLRSILAINNLKTSWLSREILLYGLFVGLGALSLLIESRLLSTLAITTGFVFLGAVEMVYSVTVKRYSLPLHSANTIATALAFAATFSQSWGVLIAILALKNLLFVYRNNPISMSGRPVYSAFSALRLILGFIIPFTFLVASVMEYKWILILSILIAELIDRLLYYNDFQPERPFFNTQN